MKFSPDSAVGVNVVVGTGERTLRINADRYDGSVLVPARGAVQHWPVDRFDALAAEHFHAVLALQPEVVVFGSGERLRFARPALLRVLIERGVGVETMDTAAACRTYNVLASEGRAVVAALLLER